MTESEFVNSLHVNQRKAYWKLIIEYRKRGMTEALKILLDAPAMESLGQTRAKIILALNSLD